MWSCVRGVVMSEGVWPQVRDVVMCEGCSHV